VHEHDFCHLCELLRIDFVRVAEQPWLVKAAAGTVLGQAVEAVQRVVQRCVYTQDGVLAANGYHILGGRGWVDN
jgi:hypothetical protein